MRIAVYTICKNEEQNVDQFMDHACEADYVVVLDTGSTDGTIDRLRERGAIIHEEIIDPWRFDVARNRCLDLVPDDVDMCFSIDLDEFPRSGWRRIVERAWSFGVTRLFYTYKHEHDRGFRHDKFHARHGYVWRHRIHETVYSVTGNECYASAEDLVVEHWPDNSKSRKSYLPLLEEELKESPQSQAHNTWLISEYLNCGRYVDAVWRGEYVLEQFPQMWHVHRSIILGYMAHACRALDDYKHEFEFRMRSCIESPRWRDPWFWFGELLFRTESWHLLIRAMEQLLSIEDFLYVATASNEPWGTRPYLFLATAFWKTGDLQNARKFFCRGLKVNVNDDEIAKAYGVFLSKTNP